MKKPVWIDTLRNLVYRLTRQGNGKLRVDILKRRKLASPLNLGVIHLYQAEGVADPKVVGHLKRMNRREGELRRYQEALSTQSPSIITKAVKLWRSIKNSKSSRVMWNNFRELLNLLDGRPLEVEYVESWMKSGKAF